MHYSVKQTGKLLKCLTDTLVYWAWAGNYWFGDVHCSVRHVTIRNCSEAERGTHVNMEHVV